MSDHVERMEIERNELFKKRNALDAFIWSNKQFDLLPKDEQALMHQQSMIMTKYLEILTMRLHKSM